MEYLFKFSIKLYLLSILIFNFNINRGDRINTPFFNCQDGFYDDYQSLNYLICHQYCSICNLEGYLQCNVNRMFSEVCTCDCPLNSFSLSDIPWCATCEVAILDIRLSDDLLAIKVQFGFSLNPNYFQSYWQQQLLYLLIYKQLQFKENICYKFFTKITFFIQFQNFINQKGNQKIQVQTHSGILPTILWLGKKTILYF